MSKYIKLFENHTQYESFTQTEEFIRPNVSYCTEENEVNYNPYIDPYNGQTYVDLGLTSGTKWAKMNVGASSEKEAGLYFAWGETQGYAIKNVDGSWSIDGEKAFSWSDYKYGTSSSNLTKYNKSDNKTHLELTDDAAHVNWGGDWHMPNRTQCLELFKETKNGFVDAGVFTEYAWDDSLGLSSPTETTATISDWNTAGYLFFKIDVSNINAAITNGDYLFIPAPGYCEDGKVYYVGIIGIVWASALVLGSVEDAWYFYFSGGEAGVYNIGRFGGLSVRGVVGQMDEITV